METLLKETVGSFLKVNPAEIGPSTVIDRSALGNSILLHRMYARFSQQGIDVPNYNSIRTFGDLTSIVNGTGDTNHTNKINVPEGFFSTNDPKGKADETDQVGIDIESLANFEMVSDYREAAFYKNNFSAEEISYCLLQENTLQSFAGLFAAKEAIVKADNSYVGTNFNAIEIKHNKQGKPIHKNFSISISHTSEVAIAVAFLGSQIQNSNFTQQPDSHMPVARNPDNPSAFTKFQLAVIIVSFVSLILSIYVLIRLSR